MRRFCDTSLDGENDAASTTNLSLCLKKRFFSILLLIFVVLLLILYKFYKIIVEIAEEHVNHLTDRQGNIFTITDQNGEPRNYADFFMVEPHNDDPRVRAQMEKDDKDLPTYEEVMAATLAASAESYAAANRAASEQSAAARSASNSTHIPIEAPPYSEIDPNPNPTSSVVASNQTVVALPAAFGSSFLTTPPAAIATNALAGGGGGLGGGGGDGDGGGGGGAGVVSSDSGVRIAINTCSESAMI